MHQKIFHWLVYFLLISILGVFVVAQTPLDLQPWLDFSMLYAADYGMLRGVNLYDPGAQKALLTANFEVDFSRLELPLYVYPPWYAFTTFFLGWLNPDQAVHLWFFINAMSFYASMFLLSESVPVKKRRWLIIAAFMYLPVLGTLFVGQFVAPVLLGVSLVIAGVKRQSALMTAVGLVLLTYKPHIGALFFLVAVLWLLANKSPWSMTALRYTMIGIFFLIGTAFIHDVHWISNYLHALRGFEGQASFEACEMCASLATLMVAWVMGNAYTSISVWVGLGFVLVFLTWLFWRKPLHTISIMGLFSITALLTLFANPYLMNYDYVMLLISVFFITHSAAKKNSVMAWGMVLLLPWLGMLAGGRDWVSQGLAIVSVIVLIFLVQLKEIAEHLCYTQPENIITR